MDPKELGNEALLFAIVFFLSLLVLGYREVQQFTSIGLFVGIYPFVWGASSAFEYEVLIFLKNKTITKNQRRISKGLFSGLGTVQLFCLLEYLGFNVQTTPVYISFFVYLLIFIMLLLLISLLKRTTRMEISS